MRLIPCLRTLSLVFVCWSSDLTDSTVWSVPTARADKRHLIMLEKVQGHQSLRSTLWARIDDIHREMWAEWLCPPRRRRSWRRLHLLLHKFRCWSNRWEQHRVCSVLGALRHQGRRVWRWPLHLRQVWWELIEESLAPEQPAKSIRASAPVQDTGLQREGHSQAGRGFNTSNGEESIHDKLPLGLAPSSIRYTE